MAQIPIEWVEWHRPTKLGVAAYESLKARVGSSEFQYQSFEDLRLTLNPDSLGREEIRLELKFDGLVALAAAVIGIILETWCEDVRDWLNGFDNLFMTIVEIVLYIIYAVLCLAACGGGAAMALKAFTYWPSVGVYVLKNRMFVRRRLRAIQKAHSYEDYLNRE